MRWSDCLHLAALLDLYVAPKPEVNDQVHCQLLREEERRAVQGAIDEEISGGGDGDTLYDVWLSFSGLDLRASRLSVRALVRDGILHRALFDLTAGHYVKSLQLGHYTEVHEVRALISGFFATWSNCMDPALATDPLWWDGIDPDSIPHKPWISKELQEDDDFLPVLKTWLRDCDSLQVWLNCFEKDTLLVNNPEEDHRVFSQKAAAHTLNFAKVRGQNASLIRFCSLHLPSAAGGCPRQLTEGSVQYTAQLVHRSVRGTRLVHCENAEVLATLLPRFFR